MKKQLLTILFCFSATLSLTTKSHAQTPVLVDYWSFNGFDTVGEAAGTAKGGTAYYFDTGAVAIVAPDYSVEPAMFYYQEIPGASTTYGGYYDTYFPLASANGPDNSDTVNLQMGAGPGSAFRARNPNDSSEILLYMSTKNIASGLVLTYGCEKSSDASGDTFNVFSYSTDSGTTWVTSGSGLSEWSDSGTIVFRRITVGISDPAAYNNPKFVFRITFVQTVSASSSGNNRIDNISLMGVPSSLLGINSVNANEAPVYTLYPNPSSSVLHIAANLDGEKSVAVYNILGEKVLEEKYAGMSFAVNTAQLNPGMYLINITETSTGSVTTKQFIKQ